ncbi:hypothetical protein AAKU55_004349 [Oxalobacteraceae bacterium GrIS 1.11]
MSAPHSEQHFQSSAMVRDIVNGMADGLTVPFALAAGLERNPAAWRDFMMRFELGLEEPQRAAAQRTDHRPVVDRRRLHSAVTVSLDAAAAASPADLGRHDLERAVELWLPEGA